MCRESRKVIIARRIQEGFDIKAITHRLAHPTHLRNRFAGFYLEGRDRKITIVTEASSPLNELRGTHRILLQYKFCTSQKLI